MPKTPNSWSIEKKIDFFSERVGECLLWKKRKPGNYPGMIIGGKKQLVSRLQLAIKLGRKLKKKEQALHTCDNPNCVEQEHLFLGNYELNARDREDKGRGRLLYGSHNGSNKLNESKVRRIKKALKRGLICRVIAPRFDVSVSAIGLIKSGRTWRHVT